MRATNTASCFVRTAAADSRRLLLLLLHYFPLRSNFATVPTGFDQTCAAHTVAVAVPVMAVLLFADHDLQFTGKASSVTFSHVVEAEIRHNIKRLSNHPSIFLWDACNGECEAPPCGWGADHLLLTHSCCSSCAVRHIVVVRMQTLLSMVEASPPDSRGCRHLSPDLAILTRQWLGQRC